MNEIYYRNNLRGKNVSILASKIWDILQKEIKDSELLYIFKRPKNGFRGNALADFIKHMHQR